MSPPGSWSGHEHVGDDDRLLRGRLLVAAGFVEWARDEVRAREHFSEAASVFRSLGHDRYLAYSTALTAATYIGDAGAYEEALRLCDESIELARRVNERPLIAQALNGKGELARVQGDDELATPAYVEGLELARAAGDEVHASFFLANLAYLADHRGDYAEALELGRRSLEICWRLGRRMMAAWTVAELAGPELGLGRPERAARLVGASDEALRILEVTRQSGDRPEYERMVTGLKAGLGDEAFRRHHAEGARLSLEEAVELALDGWSPGRTGEGSENVARATSDA